MQSGLSTFWESLFVLLSVSAIYPGVCIAMILRNMHIKAAVKAKFFAALTGMFLYISLARMFPAMQELVDAPPKENRISSKAYYQLARKKIYWRLFIANVGFVCAFGILAPLVILLLVKTDHFFRYIMKTSFKKRSKKSFATATDFWVEYVLFNFIKYISLFINCHEFQEYKS
jgi:hypothetical protein